MIHHAIAIIADIIIAQFVILAIGAVAQPLEE